MYAYIRNFPYARVHKENSRKFVTYAYIRKIRETSYVRVHKENSCRRDSGRRIEKVPIRFEASNRFRFESTRLFSFARKFLMYAYIREIPYLRVLGGGGSWRKRTTRVSIRLDATRLDSTSGFLAENKTDSTSIRLRLGESKSIRVES